MKSISKINLTKRADFDYKDFKIDGRELQIYYKSYSLAFYDKVAEIINSSKGKYAKYMPSLQQSLFDEYKAKRTKEVFRYEARFTRAKLKTLFKKEINFDKEITFINLFSQTLSQQILQYYWKKYIIDESYSIGLFDKRFDKAFQKIKEATKCRIPLQKHLSILCYSILEDAYGAIGTRELIEKAYHSRTLSRFKDKVIKKIFPENIDRDNDINYITKALEEFTPISINDIGLNEFDNVNKSKVI
jgi:hypothetical protein